jgi:pimeloyl-ACP methyl ester carboxylesterase
MTGSVKQSGLGGRWVRKPAGDSALVFVHGILSNAESCWRARDGAYWPELLKQEQEPTPATKLKDLGIYVFSYRSDLFSGNYSLGDAVEGLNAYLNLDGLFQLKTLIFVCHSMGGIVARQLLVTRRSAFVDLGIRIGLFLIASPSLGSDYVNLFSLFAKALGNSQAQALRFADNNTWLNDLDRNFINLKEGRKVVIVGQELVEDNFIIFSKLLRRQVVRPFAGAKYFGDSIKIPGSNHFDIATPTNSDSFQHRLLVRFVRATLESFDNDSRANQPRSLPLLEDALREFKTMHRTIDEITYLHQRQADEYFRTVGLFSCFEEEFAGADTSELSFMVPVGRFSKPFEGGVGSPRPLGPYYTYFVSMDFGETIEVFRIDLAPLRSALKHFRSKNSDVKSIKNVYISPYSDDQEYEAKKNEDFYYVPENG